MITMYTKHGCSSCDHMAKILTNKNIPFKKLMMIVDYSRDELLEMLKGTDIKTMPVLKLEDGRLISYLDARSMFS